MKLLSLFFFHAMTINACAQLKPVPSGVFHWADLQVKTDNLKRDIRNIAYGTTNEFEFFELHATTLKKGPINKPAHIKNDLEELIIIKEGTMQCSIGNKTSTLGPGSIILIPPLEKQKIELVGNGPLTYYVLLFRSKKMMDTARSNRAGGALLLNIDSLAFKETEKGGTRKYFDRPTAMCENYEMHVTYLAHKGASHQPHQHVDTEIILMIDGETAMTIDGTTYTAGPGDLYFVESGKLHGISNATEKPCSYFAFKWR